MSSNPYPTLPPIPPATPKRRRWIVPTVTAAVALIIGTGIGAASNSSSSADAEPTPEPETVVETVTETETVTEQVTPNACYDALDATERLVHRSVIPAFDAAADAMDAASRFDVAGIEAATARMNAITPKTEQLVTEYNDAAAECRAS